LNSALETRLYSRTRSELRSEGEEKLSEVGVKGMGIPGRSTFLRLQAAVPTRNKKRKKIAAYFIFFFLIVDPAVSGQR